MNSLISHVISRLMLLVVASIMIPLTLLTSSAASANSVASFDDIVYWVGSGSNQAALAIDWFGDASDDTALVWGYRWEDTATGEQMLREVLADDNRLFAKLSAGGSFGIATYGFGYDENDDSAFELDDNTSFDPDGIAITAASDLTESIDPADRYREGWSFGYWHYGLANGLPTSWTSSGSGPTGRQLSDGDWDSYAFATTLNNNEFAANLLAAEPASLSGDFNADGFVDAADYTVWRDGLGTTYTSLDYDDWVANYGATSSLVTSGLSNITYTIPEPATAALTLTFLAALISARFGQPK